MRVGAEAADELEQLLAFVLGLLVGLLLLTQGELRALVPERIVAGEELHAVIVYVECMSAHGVKEVTVVRHNEHRVLEIRQIFLEPCHRIEVEVIGRFVQQKVVRIAEEGFGKKHAHLLVGTYVAHEHAVTVFFDAEAAQQGRRVAFGIPAFEFGEALFKFGCPYAVGLVEIGFCIEGVFLLHYVPQMRVAAQNGFEHRAVIKFEVVLFQHAHTLARTLLYRARSGSEQPAEHTHEG